MITFRCKHCDAEHKAKPEYAGKRTRCPKCGEILLIPATRQPLSKDDIGDSVTPNATTQPSIPVTCSCGMRLKAKAEHAGRNVKCPKCGESVAVPRESNSPAADSRASLADWFDQELSRNELSPNESGATAMTTVADNTKTAPPTPADTRKMCPFCGSKNVQKASDLERLRFAQAQGKKSCPTVVTCNACKHLWVPKVMPAVFRRACLYRIGIGAAGFLVSIAIAIMVLVRMKSATDAMAEKPSISSISDVVFGLYSGAFGLYVGIIGALASLCVLAWGVAGLCDLSRTSQERLADMLEEAPQFGQPE